MLDYKPSYRRNLPHLQPPGATLFVTFRLAGSIPVAVLERLREEYEQALAQAEHITDEKERNERIYLEKRRQFGKYDAILDAGGHGPSWLRQPEIAGMVAASLHHRHDKVYSLDTFCLMPNHAHVVFTPLPSGENTYHALPRIMHSLKLHTAIEANKLLNRGGAFWQHESYDHVVRNPDEHQRIVEYVLNNPVKAGLAPHWRDWPWTYTIYEM
jgi:REP element-mobilizing transposase RayT